MKLEEALNSLSNEEKQELAKLSSDKQIRDYLKQHNLEIDENYELSDDELENVTGGLEIGYLLRILLKKLGAVEMGENTLSSLFNKDQDNDHNSTNIM